MGLIIALIVLTSVIIWTFFNLPKKNDLGESKECRDKLREYLISDVRGANQYCMAYIALLGILATIAAGKDASSPVSIQNIESFPFLISLISASFSLLFIPTGYGSGSFSKLRIIWLRTIICVQIVVVFTCYGLLNFFYTL